MITVIAGTSIIYVPGYGPDVRCEELSEEDFEKRECTVLTHGICVLRNTAYATKKNVKDSQYEIITLETLKDRIAKGFILRRFENDVDHIEVIKKNGYHAYCPEIHNCPVTHTKPNTLRITWETYMKSKRKEENLLRIKAANDRMQGPYKKLLPAGTGHSFQAFSQGVEASAEPNMQKHTYKEEVTVPLGTSTPFQRRLPAVEPRITVAPPRFFQPVASIKSSPIIPALEPRVALGPSTSVFR